MIWIDIMYAIRQSIIYIMNLIMLNALTGSCVFICFKLLEKLLEKRGLIKMSVRLLRFVILSFLIPIVFVSLIYAYDDNVIFAQDDPLPYVFGVLLLIWAVGWGKALIHSIQIYKRLKYLINTACMCEKEVVDTKEIWRKKLKIRQMIEVKYSYTIATPIICRVLKPVILLPARDYSREELDVIFVHELMHRKHKDILWKQLCAFARIVFWWNPLIQRFVYVVDSWNESYCDYAVTQVLKDKKQYFTTVCRLGIQPFQKGAYLCAALYEDKNQLKTRIYRIKAMQDTNKKAAAQISVVMILLLVSFGSVVLITQGYHRIYMSTIMMLGDIQQEIYLKEGGAETRDIIMNLKEYDHIRWNKKLPVVKMKENIKKGNYNAFFQKLKSQNRMESNWIYLKKGEIVSFNLQDMQDETLNKRDTDFISGIMDVNGRERYVMASSQILHDFEIQKKGRYKFFIENRYKSKIKIFVDFTWEK